MTISAVMTLPATDFALGEVLNETGVRIELPQFVQITDSLVPYLWVNASDHALLIDRRRRGGVVECNLQRLFPPIRRDG